MISKEDFIFIPYPSQEDINLVMQTCYKTIISLVPEEDWFGLDNYLVECDINPSSYHAIYILPDGKNEDEMKEELLSQFIKISKDCVSIWRPITRMNRGTLI